MKNIKPTIDNMTRAELLTELQIKQDEIDGLKKQLGAITHAVISNLRLTENLISNVQESLPVLEKGINNMNWPPVKVNPNINHGFGWGSSGVMGILSSEGENPVEFISDDTGRERVKKQLIQAIIVYFVFLISLTIISILLTNG